MSLLKLLLFKFILIEHFMRMRLEAAIQISHQKRGCGCGRDRGRRAEAGLRPPGELLADPGVLPGRRALHAAGKPLLRRGPRVHGRLLGDRLEDTVSSVNN